MLNQQLIDIFNSGRAWAFIGSGCSVGAGFPSWGELLEKTTQLAESSFGPLPAEVSKNIEISSARCQLPEAFALLKSHFGRQEVDEIVRGIFDAKKEPGEITKLLTQWPFASYITTNYDNLLENALQQYGGWVPVGNTAEENAKISGDVEQVIWHPHGGAHLGAKNGRLVIASTDYDEIYPAGSPTLSALEAVCRMKPIVFFGFGFKDPDLMATLQRISRFINPAFPAYGFLANCGHEERDKYWKKYKINIISYRAKGNDHSDLLNVLAGYGAFVLDRASRFGETIKTPDYDLEAAGLLTHNRLCRLGFTPGSPAIDCIARGLVLAELKINDKLLKTELNELFQKRNLKLESSIQQVLADLIKDGDVTESDGSLSLSAKGNEVALRAKAEYELTKDKFKQSINSRAREESKDELVIKNIQDVAANYLELTCKNRGLGVAQQLVATGGPENRARIVAVIQGAKKELKNSLNRDAALSAIKCIFGVLSAPRPEEKRYLGLLTQAYFGRQLLGMDSSAINIQIKNISSTAFIADSNFIIPLLAEGSLGHQSALVLFKKLITMGCQIVTSDLLLVETGEHAQWAWNLLNDNGPLSPTVIDAARGARGYRPNAFLLGYLNHPRFGPGAPWKSFFSYLFDSNGERPNDESVTECLRRRGIIVQPINKWNGFTEELFAERDQVQKEIESRRRNNSTYRHERQVKAEAEVAVIITQIRRRKLRINTLDTQEAFFLSNSRVVDNLTNQASRICVTSDSLLEWVLSIGEIKEEETEAIFDQLLYELTREGVDIVPRTDLLRLFHNTISVSKERLQDIISEHRGVIRELYAVDPEKAFLDADPLTIPIVAEMVSKEVLSSLQSSLDQERLQRFSAERKASSAMKDAHAYERLKADKKQRQEKARRKLRAAKSRHGKKRRGKKK